MENEVGIIEGVYDIVLSEVPSSLHRWGRIVWLQDIEVGVKGKLLFFEDGVCKVTSLSRITNVIRSLNILEIHTQSSIYKLRLLTGESYRTVESKLINQWKGGSKIIRVRTPGLCE